MHRRRGGGPVPRPRGHQQRRLAAGPVGVGGDPGRGGPGAEPGGARRAALCPRRRQRRGCRGAGAGQQRRSDPGPRGNLSAGGALRGLRPGGQLLWHGELLRRGAERRRLYPLGHRRPEQRRLRHRQLLRRPQLFRPAGGRGTEHRPMSAEGGGRGAAARRLLRRRAAGGPERLVRLQPLRQPAPQRLH